MPKPLPEQRGPSLQDGIRALNIHESLVGILAPVFAIRTEDDLGVGDSDAACQMIDWCHRHGLNVFQTLPLNETSDDNSPYNAISSLALDPTTIAVSPNLLPDLPVNCFQELATPDRLTELRAGPVNYPKVKELKLALLQAAFEEFCERHLRKQTARAQEFRAFVEANASWLSDYSLFRTLMEENSNSPAWTSWPPDHRSPQAARAWLESLPGFRREEFSARQTFFQYVQWIAFSQWQTVKAQAEAKSVYLMGDMPFGISRHSADTWANPDIFDLNWSGGAPPEKTFQWDVFTRKWGQNWGIPLYRWDELRRRNFDWWRTRIANLGKVFHFYRIDHVLGFFRIYSFPWTPERNAEFIDLTEEQAAARTGGHLPGFKKFPDDTPEHKAANQAQGEELLRTVLEASGKDTTVIAEDLGVVPDYVPPTLQKLGIPGFCIPMFLRDREQHYSDPKAYPRLSIAQPATHDHAPLAASWADHWANIDAGKDAEHHRLELQRFMRFAGLSADEIPRQFEDRIHEAFTRAVMHANSWLVVFQITDVFAQTMQFNVPGSAATSNWSNRLDLTVTQLDGDPRLLAKVSAFSRLARESGRTRA